MEPAETWSKRKRCQPPSEVVDFEAYELPRVVLADLDDGDLLLARRHRVSLLSLHGF